jgi:hypothetical protein
MEKVNAHGRGVIQYVFISWLGYNFYEPIWYIFLLSRGREGKWKMVFFKKKMQNGTNNLV